MMNTPQINQLLPVIALVGRPNVGKSTLFNAMTKSRNALVADEPGLTRDRQYGQCHFLGKSYLLVDTGGLSTDSNKDALAKLMAKQSWEAVTEASLVLFLVDARVGLMQEDLELAKRLRKVAKKVLLVTNKIDGLKHVDSALAEFHRLGFGEMVATAASHGRGLGELQSVIVEAIGENVEETSDDSAEVDAEALSTKKPSNIKLAIIGRPNVGKSTLVNRILGEERVVVFDMPGTTRDSIFIPFERRGKNYTVIDTAGVRRRSKVDETVEKFSVIKTLQAIEAADIVLMVFDAQEGITDQDLHLLGFTLDAGRSLMLIMNKWDGLSEHQKQRVRDLIDFKLGFVRYAKILFVSALHGTGVGDIFKWVDKIYAAAHRRASTSKMTDLLEKAVAKHQPPLVKGRRVKLRYAHFGGHAPPVIVIHGTQAPALPQAYQRYLAEFFRQALGLVGTPIRLELKSPENPYNKVR